MAVPSRQQICFRRRASRVRDGPAGCAWPRRLDRDQRWRLWNGLSPSRSCLASFSGPVPGVALLPPQTSSDEIAMLDRLGVRGARFVSPAHGAHLPQLDTSRALVERVVAAGWHIQFYPHRTDLPDFKDQLLALGTDIVFDHFAHIPAEGGVDQPAFRCLFDMLDSGRVWVKLSGPMRCTLEEPPYPSVDAAGARLGTACARSPVVGIRLAACQHDWAHHAERRRPARPPARMGARRERAQEDPGR